MFVQYETDITRNQKVNTKPILSRSNILLLLLKNKKKIGLLKVRNFNLECNLILD